VGESVRQEEQGVHVRDVKVERISYRLEWESMVIYRKLN
jgi:hypothetical protein